jgi:outer membrane protein
VRTYRNLRLKRAPAEKPRPNRRRVRTVLTPEARKLDRRRFTRVVVGALALLSLVVSGVVAQEVPAKLTLDDAIGIAKANNPGFLSTQNDAGPAGWAQRQAYAAFLPTANASGSAAWRQGGSQQFGSVTLGSAGTNYYQSAYSLSLSWTLNGQTIFGVPAARAQAKATDASIAAAAFDLESAVALQYMAVLRAQDGVAVAQRQVDRADQNLAIVKTRVEAGAAAGTDGTQAQVDLGQAQVNLIQAERQLREARAMLAQQLGVPIEGDIELVSEFRVFQPQWSRDSLIDMALARHPRLRANEAQVHAARASAKQAASRYLPSVTLFTSWTGWAQRATNEDYIRKQVLQGAASAQTNCAINNFLNTNVTPLDGYPKDCSAYVATDADVQAALDQNSRALTSFNKNPLQVALQVSVPVFTGFTRQQQVSQANAAAEDASQAVRAERLTLRTQVTQAYDALTAAYQVVQLQTRNKQLAGEQLDMQRRRYALGAAALLELMDAQTTATTADQAYLNAVYDFHLNLIRLEAAVGQRLEHE